MTPIGDVARGLSIDRVVNLDRRRARLEFDALGEIEQQLKIAVSGTAADAIVWSTTELVFDVEFLNAVNQRYSNLTRPHFTYGASLTSVDPVLLTAVVMSWEVDDRDIITGCTLAIGAANPGGAGVAFTGHLHATFQGFGAPAEYPGIDPS